MSIHALTERSSLCLTVGHGLQASSMYLFFTFGSLLAFLKFVELFIFCSNFIQGVFEGLVPRLHSTLDF